MSYFLAINPLVHMLVMLTYVLTQILAICDGLFMFKWSLSTEVCIKGFMKYIHIYFVVLK